jgi:hypothetical protein
VQPLSAARANARRPKRTRRKMFPPRTSNRATAAASAPTGTRRSTPPRTTISTVESGITRTGANEVLGAVEEDTLEAFSCRLSSRRLAKNVDAPSTRAAQHAVTVWPDAFQVVIVPRQNWSRSGWR